MVCPAVYKQNLVSLICCKYLSSNLYQEYDTALNRFFSRVQLVWKQNFHSSKLVVTRRLKWKLWPSSLPIAVEGRGKWIHVFPNGVIAKWNTKSLVWGFDLETSCQFPASRGLQYAHLSQWLLQLLPRFFFHDRFEWSASVYLPNHSARAGCGTRPILSRV